MDIVTRKRIASELLAQAPAGLVPRILAGRERISLATVDLVVRLEARYETWPYIQQQLDQGEMLEWAIEWVLITFDDVYGINSQEGPIGDAARGISDDDYIARYLA